MGKYFTTVTPNLDAGAATGSAYSDNDVLFTWTKFDLPQGPHQLIGIDSVVAGTNGAAGNSHDMTLYFAQAIDGVAPASFGTIHAATTATISAAFRRNILTSIAHDHSSITDGDHLIGYQVHGDAVANRPSINKRVLMADETPFPGDSTYSKTPQGYTSIWVAAIANGAFDFGTDVDLNMGGHQAASTAAVQITTDGTDPRIVFQPGDQIIGETGTVAAEVVSVDSATTMTVKNVTAQIDNNEQLCHKHPIRLQLSFES